MAEWDAAYINRLPDSAFLYVESGGDKDDEGKTTPRSLRHLPYKDASGNVDLPHLRNALSRLGQTETGMSDGERWLTAALRERLTQRARRILEEAQKSVLDKMADGLKALFGIGQKERQGNAFTVWKQSDDEWRWLAIYSNKFRDRDDPPEILAEAAHKEFVEAVDNGDWVYPSLRLWHVPRTDSGKADYLAYDDRGFAIASGTGDPDVMQALAAQKDLGVSHGMPKAELRYDEKDRSVIVRYRTEEISPLPAHAAANELTGFAVLEDDMALPENKKSWLEGVIGKEALSKLEQELDAKSKDAEGLEFKEEDTEGQVAEPAAEEEPQGEPPEPEPQYVTAEEVAGAVGEALAEFGDRMDALEASFAQSAEAFKALTEMVGEMKAADEQKIAKMSEETPAASLAEMIRSAIGRDETRVDGRTSLAKDKPQENYGARTGIPIVDALIGDGDWTKALEA